MTQASFEVNTAFGALRSSRCGSTGYSNHNWNAISAVGESLIASSQHMPFFLQKFAEALEAYAEAIELDSTNMSFVSNRAAVYLEQRKFQECIAEVSADIYSRDPSLTKFRITNRL